MLLRFFFFVVESFLVDLVPYQQNHDFEYQDHSISHYPDLHRLIHNQLHLLLHIQEEDLVFQENIEDQH